MADQSEVGSPLSDLSSDAFDGEEGAPEAVPMPPAKRQKRGELSMDSATPPIFHDDASISSDSEGEVPTSPNNLRPEDDDIHEQVTLCNWEGCGAGDLGNMDKLVNHIHNEHVEIRGKKYTCEWSDCTRKSLPHASAYALKAHMRSHTKEKPFYCELPECDRAFTRSDALQKHYRTVHETEALRPSDPIPKSMQANRPKLKAALKPQDPPLQGHTPGPTNGVTNGNPLGWISSFPSDLGFTAEEEARGPKELYRLLRRQVHWAEEEQDSLTKATEAMEELRKKEWYEKEILLDQCLKTELSWHERRKLVLEGAVDLSSETKTTAWGNSAYSPPNLGPSSPVPVKPQPVEDQREAAAVLASLHQA